MELSVVLVHYRSPDDLDTCLRALEPELRGRASEIVVIDNASGDAAPRELAARHPGVRLIANVENVGYARAVNQGIAATTGEFVLVMNPDCVLKPGAIATLLAHLRAHPSAAIAGPRIENPDGTVEASARSYPTPLTVFFNRYSLLTRLFPNNPWSRAYLMSDWDHASERSVDWLSGACLLVRRAAIAAVGGMDEAFFMFNEDVDWCRRMTLAGWTNDYVPAAVAVHAVGASRRRVAPKVIVERHRGMIHYFRKHHRPNFVASAVVAAVVYARCGMMLLANALRPRT